MECSVCGISESRARLFDAVSLKEKGIIKICEACSKAEGFPIIRKPTTFQLKEAEKRPSIYDRLSRARGLVPKTETQTRTFSGFSQTGREQEKTETTLKDLVDRNYKKTVSLEKKPRTDLVDNFHWIIMRTRRSKKITQAQLAKEISESEAAIKMAEQGVLPEDDYRLISKIESFLGITLVKDKVRREKELPQPARIIKFDPETAKNLTISDLKRLKELKKEVFPSENENENEFLNEDSENENEDNF